LFYIIEKKGTFLLLDLLSTLLLSLSFGVDTFSASPSSFVSTGNTGGNPNSSNSRFNLSAAAFSIEKKRFE
jgi:hypothetical protein